MENPTICLNMIVKDEADIIINTLSNIVEKIKININGIDFHHEVLTLLQRMDFFLKKVINSICYAMHEKF